MKRLFSGMFLVTFLLFAGCVSYQLPVVEKPINEFEINVPVKTVWKAVICYFSDKNIPIENIVDSLFIKTKKINVVSLSGGLDMFGRKFSVKNKWCDCGKVGMGNVFSSKTQVFLAYSVYLEEITSSKTKLIINTFFTGIKLGSENAYTGYDKSVQLTCISTGVVEMNIVKYVRNKCKTGF